MALVNIETFVLLTGAYQFIGESKLHDDFRQWIRSQEEGMKEAYEGENEDEGEDWELFGGAEQEEVRAQLRDKLKQDPQFREEFIKSLDSTRQWVDELLMEETESSASSLSA